MNKTEIKDFLDYKSDQYDRTEFIESDPICIPHQFSKKEDIEISGCLSAILAWGNRKAIIQSAQDLMKRMDQCPGDFIMNASTSDLSKLKGYYYRTFQQNDPIFFIKALQNIYSHHGGLENTFAKGFSITGSMYQAIEHVRQIFLETEHQQRNVKHFPSPAAGSSAKRMHMFLRWMCRKDNKGVDFGIWNFCSPAHLYCPLDVHTGNVARGLELLFRKQNDRKAVEELTSFLKTLDPNDPIKYDFALFGLGVFEKFHIHKRMQ